MSTLSKVVSHFLSQLENLINANNTYQQALKELTPLYNKAKPTEQAEIRNSVATLIGVKYGVVPKIMEQGANKGLLGFDAHGSKAESNARDFMRDNFNVSKPVVGKKPTKKTTRKSVDKVSKLVAEYESLSKVERRRFLTQIGQ